MNLFLLSWLVNNCAQRHFDRHVVKMILENSTASRAPGLPDFFIEHDAKRNPYAFSLPVPQTMPIAYRHREVVAVCRECGDEARALERARSQTTQSVDWSNGRHGRRRRGLLQCNKVPFIFAAAPFPPKTPLPNPPLFPRKWANRPRRAARRDTTTDPR